MTKLTTIIALFAAPLLSSAQTIYQLPKGARSSVSSMENLNGIKGQGGKTNAGAKGSAFTSLKAGDSKTLLDISRPGVIQRMWFTISDRSPAMLRSLKLRIYWDQTTTPAVDVPLGDFFGFGVGKMVAFQSALFSSPEGKSFNCYVPMPFAKGAKLTLTNESAKDLELLFFDIDFVTRDQPDKGSLYFHAIWRKWSDAILGKDVELLPRVSGQGRFLGVSVGVYLDSAYDGSWWGEGEVKMYLDGDRDHPTINGTGAEDYIGTGWGEGVFAHQYQGCLVADDKQRQYSFYRLHIPDEIWFYQDCRVTIQQIGGGPGLKILAMKDAGARLKPVSLSNDKKGFRGLFEKNTPPDALQKATDDDWMNFYRTDEYAATAYFYLDRPGR